MNTFLTEVNMEYDSSASSIQNAVTTIAATPVATPGPGGTYEYHLPHTRTIDLIGEEFAPRRGGHGSTPNVVVVSAVPISAGSVFSATSASGSSLIQTVPQSVNALSTGIPVSVVAAGNLNLSTTSTAEPPSLVEQQMNTLPLSTVTVDMPTANATEENGGVLLCNLDELSRYIPENFYADADFNLSDATSLESTSATVPSSVSTASNSATVSSKIQSAPSITTFLQSASPITTLPANLTTTTTISTTPVASVGPITIQLPTQPQPVQTLKNVTYVQTSKPQTITSSSFQPVKLTTTGFAVTPSGERIAIKGLAENNQTVQFQVKPSTNQTIQLQGLSIDPSKLTVLQELPDVGKVVIQEPSRHQHDSISNILEEMKTEEANNAGLAASGIEYATAIPVSVTNLKDPQKGLKRLGPPSTIVLPAKKGSRNIIFAGNTLPQGAIPVQINGLNTLNSLPISAVKSIPLPINLSTLTPTSAPVLTTGALPQVVSAKKTKVEVTTARTTQVTSSSTANKVNNNTLKTSGSGLSRGSSQSGGHLSTKPIGNNKTCNWQFENGEICGKTFSKSYNLVVHMRMHEDVRPFQCTLCDQTFRQKAHLQRHETTHGIGVKTNRSTNSLSPKRRRKRSARGSTGNVMTSPPQSQPPAPIQLSSNLQERLARVSEQFGAKKDKSDEDMEDHEEDEELYVPAGSVIKSYAGQKRKYSETVTSVAEAEEVKAIVQGENVTEIIELKDGEAFLEAATGEGGKLRQVMVKLQHVGEDGIAMETQNDIAVKTISNDVNATMQTSLVEVTHQVSEIKDEDIIENLGGPPQVTAVAATTLADAVSEAVGGTDLEPSTTQLVTNSSPHNDIPKKSLEPPKDILHSILVSEPGTIPTTIAQLVSANKATNGVKDGEVKLVTQIEDSNKLDPEDTTKNFSPVTVQEFSTVPN